MYEGEWYANQREGQGTMSWWDRGEQYSGEWKEGQQNGHGEHVWRVDVADNSQVCIYSVLCSIHAMSRRGILHLA